MQLLSYTLNDFNKLFSLLWNVDLGNVKIQSVGSS